MSKNIRTTQSATRPPVDALQYEKLALSAHDLCGRQRDCVNRLVNLAVSIRRCPALTADERHCQHALLELLVETAEGYQRDLELDLTLYGVIALDAKGIPEGRITARQATELLSQARPTPADIVREAMAVKDQPRTVARKEVTPRTEAGERSAAVSH